MPVHPKKSLGQHFLHDENIARKIVDSLDPAGDIPVLEIGPGKGMLTKYLFAQERVVKVMEIDREAYHHLLLRFPGQKDNILHHDFLKYDLPGLFNSPFSVIGNFPYHISSQIFFRILENRQLVRQVVCMVQKEVAGRLRALPGTKTYGILSVLLQTFYEIRQVFNVGPGVFTPPPRVQSSVIRLTRNNRRELPCSEQMLRKVVKTAFNQRRKTLRNALKEHFPLDKLDAGILALRPEQLGIEEYLELAARLETEKLP